MLIKIHMTIALVFIISIIIANDARIFVKSSERDEQELIMPTINLALESGSDIYGIQFELQYKPHELNLSKNDIISKVPGINVYSNKKESGIVQILMFSMIGDKIFDVAIDNTPVVLALNFQPVKMFNGISHIELINVILAGKGGKQVSALSYTFDVAFDKPDHTSLSKNYPNPFNPSTTIDYQLSSAGMVSISVYDLQGNKVKILVQKYQEADYHSTAWNGFDYKGESVESGRYLLKMIAPNYSRTITMTLLK